MSAGQKILPRFPTREVNRMRKQLLREWRKGEITKEDLNVSALISFLYVRWLVREQGWRRKGVDK